MRLRPHPICNILTYKLLSFSRKRAVCLSCPSQGVEKHPALSLPSQGSRLDQSSRTVSFRGADLWSDKFILVWKSEYFGPLYTGPGYRTRANMASQADEYTGGAVVVYVTVPDDTVAKTIASGVVEQKLAACVSILPGIGMAAARYNYLGDQDLPSLVSGPFQMRKVSTVCMQICRNTIRVLVGQ